MFTVFFNILPRLVEIFKSSPAITKNTQKGVSPNALSQHIISNTKDSVAGKKNRPQNS